MTIFANNDEFTPIQDYTVNDVKNALTMLKEFAEYGDEEQMDRGSRAYKQLTAYLEIYKAKNHFNAISELHVKMAMNRVMRYAEHVLDYRLSKYVSPIRTQCRSYRDADIATTRQLISRELDAFFEKEKQLLSTENGAELHAEKLELFERKISCLISVDNQLTASLKALAGPHFDEIGKLHCEQAVEKALDRADLLFRTKESQLGLSSKI